MASEWVLLVVSYSARGLLYSWGVVTIYAPCAWPTHLWVPLVPTVPPKTHPIGSALGMKD